MLRRELDARPMNDVKHRAVMSAARPSGILVGVSPLAGLAVKPSLAEGLPALHVLVVDDDAAVRKACCEIAAGMGFITHAADSVTAARAMLKTHTVDLLLLDLKLPGGAVWCCWKR